MAGTGSSRITLTGRSQRARSRLRGAARTQDREEQTMAWYTPTHSCGHDGERIQLYGQHTERARRLEVMGREACSDCRVARAAEAAASAGLPPLVGSLKQ